MKEYKEVQTTKTEISKITCDKCKKEATSDEFIYGGIPMHSIELSGGFNSQWPGDLTTIQADFCEDCLEELIGEYVTVKRSRL